MKEATLPNAPPPPDRRRCDAIICWSEVCCCQVNESFSGWLLHHLEYATGDLVAKAAGASVVRRLSWGTSLMLSLSAHYATSFGSCVFRWIHRHKLMVVRAAWGALVREHRLVLRNTEHGILPVENHSAFSAYKQFRRIVVLTINSSHSYVIYVLQRLVQDQTAKILIKMDLFFTTS